MQIVQYLFLIKVKRATVKVERDVRQTTGIVGKGALALAGQLNGTLEFGVEDSEPWNGNTGPLDKGVIFFS